MNISLLVVVIYFAIAKRYHCGNWAKYIRDLCTLLTIAAQSYPSPS